jgi:steroid delta-isomerase-like uncharacterized protein
MSIDENKSVIRQLEEALSSGQADAGLELYAEEFLYNGQRVGRDYLVHIRAPLWEAVPDVQWTIEEMVAEGNAVTTLWTVTGTHLGDFAHSFLGLGTAPASWGQIHYSYMVLHRLADGVIVEARDVSDRLTLLLQLGVIAAPS